MNESGAVNPWDIIIHANDYITYQYCSETNQNWVCIERMTVVPFESLQVQNYNTTESFSNTAVYVIVILLLIWFVKWIFRLILPSKWKK